MAHCSDFFQVWANSSLDVFTASSRSPMLSCRYKREGDEADKQINVQTFYKMKFTLGKNKRSSSIVQQTTSITVVPTEELHKKKKKKAWQPEEPKKESKKGKNYRVKWEIVLCIYIYINTMKNSPVRAWPHWWQERGAGGNPRRCPGRRRRKNTGKDTSLNCGSPAHTHFKWIFNKELYI